jgi:hypothetical protein
MCPAYAVPGSIRIYGSERINELSRVRAARLNILILLKISASDAAVKSILRTAASTGMDTESQINLLRVATRWLVERSNGDRD